MGVPYSLISFGANQKSRKEFRTGWRKVAGLSAINFCNICKYWAAKRRFFFCQLFYLETSAFLQTVGVFSTLDGVILERDEVLTFLLPSFSLHSNFFLLKQDQLSLSYVLSLVKISTFSSAIHNILYTPNYIISLLLELLIEPERN